MDTVATVRALATTKDAVGDTCVGTARVAVPALANGVAMAIRGAEQVAVIRPVAA